MAGTRILVVEDLPSLAMTYAAHLEQAGYQPVIAGSGAAALQALAQQGPFGAILLDLQLPDIDGLALLRGQPHMLASAPVVVATANASLARAIEAMRLGAFEFLVKPLAPKQLLAVIGSAVELGGRQAGAPAIAQAAPLHGFIGQSAVMQQLYRQIERIAPSRAPVFITGESGTGKDLCAQAIHHASGRGSGPFIAVNCGAIPENQLESEVFGHLKGAFAGAVADRAGAMQAAHKGTLFLDEICEMAPSVQVKLLRFLQTGTVQPVGAARGEDVDVRIVCATNRPPEREVAEGRFRDDLYYRLAVVPLHMPPLRARAGDVAQLAEAFLQRFAAEEGKRFVPLGPEHVAALQAYGWPGNVRELQNVIRRAAVLFDGPELPLRALPATPPMPGAGWVSPSPAPPSPPQALAPSTALPTVNMAMLAQAMRGLTLDEIERLVIEAAITEAGGSLPAAARALGVSPSTLYRKRERWTASGRSA